MLYLETAWKSRYAHFTSSEYGDQQATHQLDPTRVISFVTRDCEKQITNKKYSSVSGFMGLPTRVFTAAGGSTSCTSISIKWAFHQSLCVSGSPRSLPHPHTSMSSQPVHPHSEGEPPNSFQLRSLGAFRHNGQ